MFGEPMGGMDHGTLGMDMDMMGMDVDVMSLEEARPFDRAFIDAMIAHHQGAIRMARVGLERGEDEEVEGLAEAIVDAQSREIEEMNEWRERWYGSPSPAGGIPERRRDDAGPRRDGPLMVARGRKGTPMKAWHMLLCAGLVVAGGALVAPELGCGDHPSRGLRADDGRDDVDDDATVQQACPPHRPPPRVEPLAIGVEDLRCTCCAEDVLEAVRALDGVRSAELDYQRAELRVDRDPAVVDADAVRDAVRARGYRCEGDAGASSTGQLAHTAQLAPITCGTKCDRMQYELPHTRGHEEHHDPSQEAADRRPRRDVARHVRPDDGGGDGARHAQRFFIALVLTIPVILLSPLAVNTFGLELVDSETARNWLMLVLSTPVVWWAGWIFIGGRYTSLRSRALNMSVLIATGVLAAWLSSVLPHADRRARPSTRPRRCWSPSCSSDTGWR